MSARAVWTGLLGVGLVNIPAKLYKATDDPGSETKMNDLHVTTASVHQLGRKTWCHECNCEVPTSEVGKGVKTPAGYIVITADEIAAIKPESSDALVIESVVPCAEIDPLYIAESHYLRPDGKAAQSGYDTLVLAMRNRNVALQGRLTIYGRERTVTIRDFDGTMVVQSMRSVNEVRSTDELPGDSPSLPIAPAQIRLAEQLLDTMIGQFDPAEYVDEFAEDFKKLVASKATGEAPPTKAGAPAPPKTTDVMAALQASLAGRVPVKVKKLKPGAAPRGPAKTKKKSA